MYENSSDRRVGMIRIIHDDIPAISAKTDEVILVGPDDVDISLTPSAANRTAEGLIEKAAEAIGKRAAIEDDCKRMAAGSILTGRLRMSLTKR